jgi:hypothetical protein
MEQSNTDAVFQAIDRLIVAAAPERRADLDPFWSRYRPQFVLGADRPGFVMEANPFGAVIFTNKALLQLWLLGFAAWRAVEAYSTIIRVCAGSQILFDPPSVAELPGQRELDAQFDRLLASAAELGKARDDKTFHWPEDVPQPGTENFASIYDKAAHDLVCIATAYFFLHELKHLAFAQDLNAPNDPLVEELACDRFARDFLLDMVPAFAAGIGKSTEEVLAKRVAALSLAAFVLLDLTPLQRWNTSRTHPAMAERYSRQCRLITDGLLVERRRSGNIRQA